jgi:hypothetical protein
MPNAKGARSKRDLDRVGALPKMSVRIITSTSSSSQTTRRTASLWRSGVESVLTLTAPVVSHDLSLNSPESRSSLLSRTLDAMDDGYRCGCGAVLPLIIKKCVRCGNEVQHG